MDGHADFFVEKSTWMAMLIFPKKINLDGHVDFSQKFNMDGHTDFPKEFNMDGHADFSPKNQHGWPC